MTDQVSIAIEKFSHVPGGANVMFLDGHVEFIKYPGRFPVAKNFILAASVFGA
jgi:prepilin-type processing-associated H-X9-DG protein